MKYPAAALPPLLVIGAAVFVRSLAIAPHNPAINNSRTMAAHVAIPPAVNQIFVRACYNCHSFKTEWPWYVHLPIVSNVLRRDVERARSHMNFSDWNAKLAEGDDEARGTLNGICEDLRSGSMPKRSYRRVHREAELSKADVAAVCQWTDRVADPRSQVR